MSNPMIEPYLMFSGRCDEALAFYGKAIGAEIEMLMRFNESPDPVPEGMLAPGFESKVMHSSMMVRGSRIMASDGCDANSVFGGFSLCLPAKDEADAHQLFNGLAEGGNVTMPLSKTFWSPCYGMLTDKFGVGWMVMVPGEMP